MRQWQEHAVSVFEPGENDLQRPGDLGEHLSARSAVAVRVGTADGRVLPSTTIG
jgi:hypothetical protein